MYSRKKGGYPFTFSKNQEHGVNKKERKFTCNRRDLKSAQTNTTELINCNLVSVAVFKLCDLRACVRLGTSRSPSPPISSQDLVPRRKKLSQIA